MKNVGAVHEHGFHVPYITWCLFRGLAGGGGSTITGSKLVLVCYLAAVNVLFFLLQSMGMLSITSELEFLSYLFVSKRELCRCTFFL